MVPDYRQILFQRAKISSLEIYIHSEIINLLFSKMIFLNSAVTINYIFLMPVIGSFAIILEGYN